MARKTTLEFNEPEEILEHQDEKSEHRTDYPGAKEETALEAANQHVVQFKDKLETINEHAHFAFDHREDIGGYPAEDRKEMINSYAQAFNAVEFNNNANDRLEAAQDVAQTIFQPMHDYVATNVLASQFKVDPELVKAMEDEGVQYVEKMLTRDQFGNAALKFTVKDQEAAERIAERFEGKVAIITKEDEVGYTSVNADKIIQDYQNRFAETLNMNDGSDPALNERLVEIFNEAHEYSRNQWTKEPVEAKDMNEDEFSQLATLNDVRRYMEVDRMLHNTWKDLLEPINEMHWKMDPQYDGANEVYRTIEDVHARGIWATLENQNYDNFKMISENIEGCKEEFAQAMNNNTGFVKLEDYQKPSLSESFNTPDDAETYSDSVTTQIYRIRKENEVGENNEAMSPMAYHIAVQMKENFNLKLQAIEEAQDLGRDQTEEYASLYKTAKGLDYIMKSKEEEKKESVNFQETAAQLAAATANIAMIASTAA